MRMTHNFGLFESWREKESLRVPVKVKANFRYHTILCAQYVMEMAMMLPEVYVADDAGTRGLQGCGNIGNDNRLEKWKERLER